MNRAEFLSACTKGREVRTIERPGRVYLRERHQAFFALWASDGAQPGMHLRSTSKAHAPSKLFRGETIWVHLEKASPTTLPALIAESCRLAAARGGGAPLPVYRPLAKAIEVLQAPVVGLGAGGPAVKVLSGEGELAVALCRACLERTRSTARADEVALITRIEKLLTKSVRNEVWYPLANALPYGTAGAKRAAADRESAALQSARALIGSQNAGSQSCLPYVTAGLVRAVAEVQRSEGPRLATEFVRALDELTLGREFEAAHRARLSAQAPRFTRVLWRGADPKGFPAWWLVQLGEHWGLLGKPARRWVWEAGTPDDVLALVPDAHFEQAVEHAMSRST